MVLSCGPVAFALPATMRRPWEGLDLPDDVVADALAKVVEGGPGGLHLAVAVVQGGHQYEERSVSGEQEVRPFSSEARSEWAFVVSLPKKLCMWEAPGRPGKMIGSSGARWVYGHSARNSATRTTSAAARGATSAAPRSAAALPTLAWTRERARAAAASPATRVRQDRGDRVRRCSGLRRFRKSTALLFGSGGRFLGEMRERSLLGNVRVSPVHVKRVRSHCNNLRNDGG